MPGTLYDNPNLFTETISAVTATNTVQLGAVRYWNGGEYKYVYNGDAVAIAPGNAVNLSSGGSGTTISASMTTGDAAYGVVQNATLTTNTYGWVLRRGIGMVTVASNSVAETKILCVTGSGTFGDMSLILVGGMSGTTGGAGALLTSYQPVGRSLGSGATGATILAAVNFSST